jgi:hypothetical protein
MRKEQGPAWTLTHSSAPLGGAPSPIREIANRHTPKLNYLVSHSKQRTQPSLIDTNSRVGLSGGNYVLSFAGPRKSFAQQALHFFDARFFAPDFFFATLPFVIFRASLPA